MTDPRAGGIMIDPRASSPFITDPETGRLMPNPSGVFGGGGSRTGGIITDPNAGVLVIVNSGTTTGARAELLVLILVALIPLTAIAY